MSEIVAVICAHPDDEVLGCGGTIARHTAAGDEVTCIFLADGESSRGPNFDKGKRRDASIAAAKLLGTKPPKFFAFDDQKLDARALLDITQAIEEFVLCDLNPAVVYTHHAGDLNKDHRIVHEAVMTAFRPLPKRRTEKIFAFEVPSSTELGTGFSPNHFVDISKEMKRKLLALDCYSSEMRNFPHPRSMESIAALAQWRGATVGLTAAEAFMTLRSIER